MLSSPFTREHSARSEAASSSLRPEERRRAPRYELLAQVYTRLTDEDYVLELSDISALGALLFGGTLKRPPWLMRGMIVHLSIIDPVTLGAVEVEAEVVRITYRRRRWGFAVEFRDLNPKTKGEIAALTELGRPRPPPLPTNPRDPECGPERRRYPRYELLAQVHARQSDEDYVLELSDISLGGALVYLGSLSRPSWLEVGEKVALAIIDPVRLDPINVSGTVARTAKRGRCWGFAVEFGALDEQTEADLRKLVQLGRPKPPPLPR